MELGWVQVGLRLKLRSRWQVSVPHSTPFQEEVRVQVGRKETPSYFKNSLSGAAQGAFEISYPGKMGGESSPTTLYRRTERDPEER